MIEGEDELDEDVLLLVPSLDPMLLQVRTKIQSEEEVRFS